ncbi:NYN domain-containing protein [Geitlerinema sp. PCC 9228]|uniref:NYN domain-containing protein n=1 Tax=Geitlerinema sp. PCC 9228 TaxID=111611 RepID=UPI0008F9856C|nr:NYN domain-containing protein [Geitlerinema sp. PCC 9228]
MSQQTSGVVLLVDGYNIVGSWAHLIKIRDRDGLEAARDQLTEALVNYSACQKWETRLVFDAQFRGEPSSVEAVTRYVSIYYTESGQTADDYIEKVCAELAQRPQYRKLRAIVATSDRAQQLTVMGYGAEWMSAKQLELDIDRMARSVRRNQRTPKRSQGRFLVRSLDPDAQERLDKLRFGIRS